VAGLRSNLIANFTGQGAATLIQLAITPVYIRWLGVEAYGLIGFQLTLQALMQVLDFGLSPTINRELARFSALPDKAQESRDFVRTLETGYWLIGAIIGLAIYAAAPYLGAHWLNRSSLPAPVVEKSLRMIAVLIAAQWPLTFYQGGLLGLQRHTSLNIARVATTAAAAIGGYVLVAHLSLGITMFFAWQAAISLLNVALVAWLLWRSLPVSAQPPHFRLDAVRHVGRFAAGMTVITITSLLITQLDKLVLSRVVSLEQFGYYVVAALVSNGLSAITRPMFMSIFPRFSALVAASDDVGIERTYRRGWRLMMALVVPVTAVTVVFSYQLFALWTRNEGVARAAAPIASLLVVGTALNGLMSIPFALQLARGWTSLSVKTNVALTLVACPAVLWAAQRYGTIGAAWVWPTLMALYMAMALPAIHRALLPGLGVQWFFRDVVIPVSVAAMVAFLAGAFLPSSNHVVWMGSAIAIAWIATATALVVSNRGFRRDALEHAAILVTYARNRPFEIRT